MESIDIKLEPMTSSDIAPAVELIRDVMNEDEAAWAEKTMKFHFECIRHGINDGRDYFLWKQGGSILALAGLHNYIWGPRENVWLAWFAVARDYQRKGLGSRLLDEVQKLAVKMKYKKFFVETYDNPVFEKARAFYQSQGFVEAGVVDNYLPDGSTMIVYEKQLLK